MRNVVVAQSGGPTAVINASLLGVIHACRSMPGRFGRLYAARHGIEGLLYEELLDLSAQEAAELELLRTTPAAGAIGTCRYKIGPDATQDVERILEVLAAHGIGAFFYIGGNDSMDTVQRVSDAARERGLDLICTGIPKTIDNDLGDDERVVIDHTPGYGSAARYWASLVLELNEENRGSSPADPVLVVQAMGRRIGYLAAAARLADPDRTMPLQIYLPEAGVSLPEIAENVEGELRRSGRVIVVVSEGVEIGDLGERRDAFGHAAFGSSRDSVAQALVNFLNDRGLPVRGAARGQIPGTHQRHAILCASPVDLDEAYEVGRHAVEIAVRDGTGYMATVVRALGPDYRAVYGKAPLRRMAGSERRFPREWIAASRCDVTDAFVTYARPLIGEGPPEVPLRRGLPRFAQLQSDCVSKRLSPYTPEAYREAD